MEKKRGWLFIFFLFLFCGVCPQKTEAQTVRVTIPDFPVTVNGQPFENTYNQYPLLVYKGITYFPMTYDYAAFLGVKVRWYANSRMSLSNGVLFVGVAEHPSEEPGEYLVNTPNNRNQTAAIPSYDIALNDTWSFLANDKEEYPILNFRDITYFPLTWRFCVDEFGWTYSWNEATGLQIDSTEPFRPVIDDRVLGATLPSSGLRPRFYYGESYYVVYPSSTFYSLDFTVRKRGGAERSFSISGQLSGGDYSFNQRTDTVGLPVDATSDIPPSVEGDIFSVVCIKQHPEAEGYQNVLLKIDLAAGQVISEESIAPRPAS